MAAPHADTPLVVPSSELWAIRDRALAALFDVAEDADKRTVDRIGASEIILIDIREHRAQSDLVNKVEELQREAADLRAELRERK